VIRLLALVLAAAAAVPYNANVSSLSAPQKATLAGAYWRAGCPVPLSELRLLTVSHWGFDGRVHEGQLVVDEAVAGSLTKVFRRLYELRFPIRHMSFAEVYGPASARPRDGDLSGSFECRQAVPSPCTGGKGTGTWSNHAYGHAIDLNPVENPYVGCGQTRDPKSVSYMDRSRLRKGMVTPAVVRAFRSIGWGWGGDWSGRTKDYMHFSTNGH
jgi:hypothetical protein